MGTDATPPARKFKLPKKVSVEFNPVDPASVPRKLRSAIRKRSSEPASVLLPDPKRLNSLANGAEPVGKDCLKISKISTQNGCSDHSQKKGALLPISKDEEEVAETLFALAGMIPLSNINMKDKKDGGLSVTTASDFAEKVPAQKDSVISKESEVTRSAVSAEETTATIPTSDGSKSLEEAPPLSERRQLNTNLKVSVPRPNLQTIPPLLRTCDQRSWVNSTLFSTANEPRWKSGLNEIKGENVLLPNNESHTIIGAVDIAANQERQQATSVDRKGNGLPSRALHGSAVGLPLQSSAAIFPSWLSISASSSGLGTHVDTVPFDKVSGSIDVRGKSRKRCATHVYISRLIQVMKISEGRDNQPLDTNRLGASQCSSGEPVPPNHSSAAKNEINAMCAPEAANCLSRNHISHQKQEEGPSFSGCCSSKNQNFNFLSLSAGTAATADDAKNGMRNNLAPGTKSQIPYLHSAAQHSASLPFSMPPNCLPSNSYQSRVSTRSAGHPSQPTQVPLQLPPYFGTPIMGTPTIQQLQPTQQQQQIWRAQVAARFRHGPLLASQVSNWQNQSQEQRSSTLAIRSLPSTSQPSLETHGGPKYLQVSQQQPQLLGFSSSLPAVRAKLQQSQIPPVYEDNRFRSDGVFPLQLLCNERV